MSDENLTSDEETQTEGSPITTNKTPAFFSKIEVLTSLASSHFSLHFDTNFVS